jgi:hypothetical protein
LSGGQTYQHKNDKINFFSFKTLIAKAHSSSIVCLCGLTPFLEQHISQVIAARRPGHFLIYSHSVFFWALKENRKQLEEGKKGRELLIHFFVFVKLKHEN